VIYPCGLINNLCQIHRGMNKNIFWLFILLVFVRCNSSNDVQDKSEIEFPDELVHFVPYRNSPVFSGTDTSTWDRHIRERGWILKEDNVYRMWYTGYEDINAEKHLGYATSPDGVLWTRNSTNAIYDKGWVEDMSIIKSDSTYYMFAEGRGDTAHLLTSPDGLTWTERGNLDIRQTNGSPITRGAFGTPTIWNENGEWFLFYERDDHGIWLARSTDLKVWTNIKDEPVIAMGPDAYDKFAVAMNQVIKYNGRYYGYYHASAFADWREWSTNVAVSTDLINWKKYSGNPILHDNKSSGIMIHDGKRYRLYTMHDKVNVHFPVTDSLP